MCNICARCSKTMLVFWEILLSLSARRVWIEIAAGCTKKLEERGSLSARRVWIEISITGDLPPNPMRHSPRGGCGLKLEVTEEVSHYEAVTLREEGVD